MADVKVELKESISREDAARWLSQLSRAFANGHEGEAHEDPGGHGIHMPSPSYFPLIAALGFPIMATGLIYDYALVAVGAAVLFVGIYGWALEPATEGEEA